jgi:hypothetical protein
VLRQTLLKLDAPERTAVEFAALLPVESVPWPWLRALVEQEHSDMLATQPGYPDPWLAVRRRLEGLRLLTPSDHPNLARMHRLVNAHLRSRSTGGGTEQRLVILSAFFRWMMRDEWTGYRFGEPLNATEWTHEILATLVSGVFAGLSEPRGTSHFETEDWLCGISLNYPLDQPPTEYWMREFVLSRDLKSIRDGKYPPEACLDSYSELAKQYRTYGFNSFPGRHGFCSIDDVFVSLCDFLGRNRKVKEWNGFVEWACEVEAVAKGTSYVARRKDWAEAFRQLVATL